MGTRTIYFDESGFTGYNLLDAEQPVFTVAGAAIEEKLATEILTEAFPGYQGKEFKFTNIWNGKQRAGLVRFAARLEAVQDLAFIYMIDKRFAVLTKIVDFLIEPYITDAGYDFYDDGFCWKYCNYIHFGFTQFAPPELLDALLKSYQAFSRKPSEKSLATLQSQLRIMAASADERVQVFLEQMELGARLFHKYHNLGGFKGSDELQATTMFAAVSHFRQRFTEDFEIVHDASSNFLRSKDLWQRMTSDSVPEQMHRLGDGSFVAFPLRITSTQSANSTDSRAIQFCDVLAGLSTRCFDPRTTGEDEAFLQSVIDAGLKHVTYNGIRPQLIFPDQIPPKRLSGPDIVDQMMGIMFGPHNAKS